MIYGDFQGKKLSLLGFGAMRLPLNADKTPNERQVADMVRLAMEGGVNYFDTAWPYHEGLSETVMGRALAEYPRDSWYLADKYPGHQIASRYDPSQVFEAQLEKCGVAYFDFYLLHNVYEKSIETYRDPRWGIVEYFQEQKRRGRIRHLGFSTHGQLDCLRDFLDAYGADMEFCQIQLNWLDWTLQNAKAKVELLRERGIPVWVMEPVRGGRLCSLSAADEAALRALRPQESVPAWGFRFLQDIPDIKMILSGMSSKEQMAQNIQTFAERKPLTDRERDALLAIARGMQDNIPCTACRYCLPSCPQGLDIPLLLSVYNELRFAPQLNSVMRVEALPRDKRPAACVACGACAAMCPQGIDIPACMRDLAQRIAALPSWAEICRQRDEAAQRLAAAERGD